MSKIEAQRIAEKWADKLEKKSKYRVLVTKDSLIYGFVDGFMHGVKYKNKLKAKQPDGKITINDVKKILNQIRKFDDLRDFQSKKAKQYCDKYGIKPSQLNFLVSVIAVERSKSNGNFYIV